MASCHAYVPECDNVPRPNRLFSCRKAQGTSSEIVEVGDLSRRKNKFDKAVVGLFSNHDDGQHRWKRSPQSQLQNWDGAVNYWVLRADF
jgi:hypothetical protein